MEAGTLGYIFRWMLELAPLIAITILLAMFAWRRAFKLDWRIIFASAKATIGWFLLKLLCCTAIGVAALYWIRGAGNSGALYLAAVIAIVLLWVATDIRQEYLRHRKEEP